MDSGNEETPLYAPEIQQVGSRTTSNEGAGWFLKQKPNSKQRVMPEKGWCNHRDKQTTTAVWES
ncbi:hypothetical protein [Microseira sp. BLCC-F43]|jgi:hypothetical protein|uniref:hypothetical protein n=1 Tax=Microseira sp. BLCC-F43 TaxID=3153602 RepID=UPI0035B6DB10